MTDFVRVRDSLTGHEYSTPPHLVRDGLTIVDKPAVSPNGTPLPPKFRRTLAVQEPFSPPSDVTEVVTETDHEPEEGQE